MGHSARLHRWTGDMAGIGGIALAWHARVCVSMCACQTAMAGEWLLAGYIDTYVPDLDMGVIGVEGLRA